MCYYGKYWQCKRCTEQEKVKRGCTTEVENQVWKITSCYRCGGFDKECPECNGSNSIQVKRCPRSLVMGIKPRELLLYCNRYVEYGEYPDKEGALYQPIALVNALEIYREYLMKYKQEVEAKDNK